MIVYNHIVTECGITLVWGGHVKFWYSDEPPQNEQQKHRNQCCKSTFIVPKYKDINKFNLWDTLEMQ